MNVAKCVEYFISTQTTPQDMRPRTSPLKIVPNFFSKDECDFFITLILKKSTDITNGKQLIFNSEVAAEWVWKRIKNFIPFRTVFDEHNDRWEVVGINPRFRVVRYFTTVEPQMYKANTCWNSWNRKTFATGMVHLNSTSGGATHFPSIHTTVEAVEKSLVLFLFKDLDFCGEKCEKEKYLLEFDVVYELVMPEWCETEFIEKRKLLYQQNIK